MSRVLVGKGVWECWGMGVNPSPLRGEVRRG